jgi:hypothetical protein
MVQSAQGEAPLRVSIGFALIEAKPGSAGYRADPSYFRAVAENLKVSALAALDQARRAGGGAVRGSTPLAWPEPVQGT